MFFKNRICPKCKIGKESYNLDRHSFICPYIRCLENGKCSFFVPLEKTSKINSFKKKMFTKSKKSHLA